MFGKIFKLLSPIQWVELGLIVIILFSVFNFTSVVFDGIKEKFGFETKASLKEQTIKQASTIKTLDNANSILADTIKTNEVSATVNKDVVVKKFQADLKVEDKVKVIETKKTKVISEIKTQFNSLPIDSSKTVQMEKEVSTHQINFLWEIYCSEANNVEECKVNKNNS